jgi:anti-sigma regulatory factor (Ser/Thr protein kinase)
VTYSISATITNRLDHVWMLRAAMAGVLEQRDVTEVEIGLLQVALGEVVNNCIEHGYQQGVSGVVELVMHLRGSELTLDIFDDAPPVATDQLQGLFDASGVSEDPTDAWPARGHGLQIVRQITDYVGVHCIGGRNRVQLRKHLSATLNS